ncbi:MAG TPA: methylmalonyl Co-A mutase-associated GTPase MeaB, partial [Bacillota bacterium]
TGRAFVLGVTGAPGVGKSTLVSGLIQQFRGRGQRVGVIAVDPSSPFSGGAILGDRIRLAAGPRDAGVFFRSLANRGQTGGVSRATHEVICLLDAAGFEVIILETVGAGQSEVDVMRFADTVLVVTAPGLGDDVQAFKAGILEIGDIFVVNKADRDGADRTVSELKLMLSLVEYDGRWQPIVVKTVAQSGEGLDQLMEAIDRHRQHQAAAAVRQQRSQDLAERQLSERIGALLLETFRQAAAASWDEAVTAIAQRRLTPRQAAEQLLGDQDIVTAAMAAIRRQAGRQEDPTA